MVVDHGTFCIHDINMEDTDNPGIQKWVIGIVVVVGKDHNVAVGGVQVDGVLLSANIICSIIHTKDVMQIHVVVLEQQSVMI